MDTAIRARYAPSPTGLQHPGSIRTALFCWLFARANKGAFIVRIEDTDKVREVKEAEEYLYSSLRWLGLEWDEGPDVGGPFGPYKQSERLETYEKYANALIQTGRAYADPYTQTEVEQFRTQSQKNKQPFLFRSYRPANPPKWQAGMPLRFKVEQLKSYAWQDAVRGRLSAGPEALDDFVILKADGYPTYNFANVIDDHLMKITHVLRGEEYLASIPKYLALYEAFGWEAPINATMPLVLAKSGGKKLSKRDGSLPLLEYKEQGYLAEAMNNFLATLGWNDGTQQEVFTTKELIKKFTLSRLQKSPARFEIERLNYLNGVHIRKLDLDELLVQVQSFWPKPATKFRSEYKRSVLSLIQQRLKKFDELAGLTSFFFTVPNQAQTKALLSNSKALKNLNPKRINELLDKIQQTIASNDFDQNKIEANLRNLVNQMKLSTQEVFMATRIAITGSEISPGLFETMDVLGKEQVLARLEQAHIS